MIEKLMEVLDLLRKRYGYKAQMIYQDGCWSCLVEYIDQGPRFDYVVNLDHWVLQFSPAVIAAGIVTECEEAITYA